LGATASAPNQYSASSGPANAIDGIYPASFSWGAAPGIFHSGVIGPNAILDVALAKPATLASLTIYGRQDCCYFRDVYNIRLLDAAGQSLWTGTLDASQANGLGATIELNLPATPEASTMMMMLMGVGGLGLTAARRKQAAPASL
jgi:hypothetical protein